MDYRKPEHIVSVPKTTTKPKKQVVKKNPVIVKIITPIDLENKFFKMTDTQFAEWYKQQPQQNFHY